MYDICAEGFNLVNIDYVLVPEYHFPDPLVQANEAFRFLMEHSEEYHLYMNRVVIMGSSAGEENSAVELAVKSEFTY